MGAPSSPRLRSEGAPVPSLVSLTDVKKHLNLTSTSNDDELLSLIDTAEEIVRAEARQFDVATYAETLWVTGGYVILSHTPVQAVTSVTSAGETITGTTFTASGLLEGLRGWREVAVTYTAGHPVPSARAYTATLMVAARLWETQRGPSPVTPTEEPTFTPGMQGILGEIRAVLGNSGGLGVIV